MPDTPNVTDRIKLLYELLSSPEIQAFDKKEMDFNKFSEGLKVPARRELAYEAAVSSEAINPNELPYEKFELELLGKDKFNDKTINPLNYNEKNIAKIKLGFNSQVFNGLQENGIEDPILAQTISDEYFNKNYQINPNLVGKKKDELLIKRSRIENRFDLLREDNKNIHRILYEIVGTGNATKIKKSIESKDFFIDMQKNAEGNTEAEKRQNVHKKLFDIGEGRIYLGELKALKENSELEGRDFSHNRKVDDDNWFKSTARGLVDIVQAQFGNEDSISRLLETFSNTMMASEMLGKEIPNIGKTIALDFAKLNLENMQRSTAPKDKETIEGIGKAIKAMDNEAHKNYTEMYNNNIKIRSNYEDRGLIDPSSTNMMYSIAQSAPLTLAGIGAGMLNPSLGIAVFVGESMSRTGADFYALGAKKDTDGTIKEGTGNLSDGQVGQLIGIIQGFIEATSGSELIVRTGIKQLLKKGGKEVTIDMGKLLLGKKIAKEWGKTIAGESIEELEQGFTTQLGEMVLGYRDNIDTSSLIDAMTGGVAGGLVFGSLGASMITIGNTSNLQKIKNEATKRKKDLEVLVDAGRITEDEAQTLAGFYEKIENIKTPEESKVFSDNIQAVMQPIAKLIELEQEQKAKFDEAYDTSGKNIVDMIEETVGEDKSNEILSAIEQTKEYQEVYDNTDKNKSEEERRKDSHEKLAFENRDAYSNSVAKSIVLSSVSESNAQPIRKDKEVSDNALASTIERKNLSPEQQLELDELEQSYSDANDENPIQFQEDNSNDSEFLRDLKSTKGEKIVKTPGNYSYLPFVQEDPDKINISRTLNKTKYRKTVGIPVYPFQIKKGKNIRDITAEINKHYKYEIVNDRNGTIQFTNNPKPIEELFDSNPESANQVYEASEVAVPKSQQSSINSGKIEQLKEDIRDLRGNDGVIPDNNLPLFRSIVKQIKFLERDLLTNINIALEEFINVNKLSNSDAKYLKKLAAIRNNFQELVEDFNKAKKTNFSTTESMTFFDSGFNLQQSIETETEIDNKKTNEYENKLLKDNGFEANKDYTADELNDFVQKHGSKQVKLIWNLIKNVAQKLDIATRFQLKGKSKIPSDAAGHYFNGQVENNASLFSVPDSAARIIVHELVHGVTSHILIAVEENNKKVLSKLTARQLKAVEKLNALLGELKKDKDFDDTYGTKNSHELLAELTNDNFVEKLKAKNIFEKILAAIFEIFNIPFNTYTESIKILEDLISNPIIDDRYEGSLDENYNLYSQVEQETSKNKGKDGIEVDNITDATSISFQEDLLKNKEHKIDLSPIKVNTASSVTYVNNLKDSKGNKRFATSDKDNNIQILKDFTPEEFFTYFEGKDNSKFSEQKKEILDLLETYGISIADIKSVLTTKEDIQQFLIAETTSHIVNNDRSAYLANKDVLSPDKIVLGVRATRYAYNQIIIAKEIAKQENIAQKALKSLEPTQMVGLTKQIDSRLSIAQNKLLPEQVLSQVTSTLKTMGVKDDSIGSFADWVLEQVKDMKVKVVSGNYVFDNGTIFSPEDGPIRRGAYERTTNTIYINGDLVTLEYDADEVYHTLIHEGIHAIITEKLLTDRQFSNDIGAIYDSMMKIANRTGLKGVSQDDIKRISYDKNAPAAKREGLKLKALNEFVAYAMSNTSSIHQWMKNNEISENESFLRRFVDKLRQLFQKILGGKPATYYSALELTLAKHFDISGNYKDILKENTDSLEREETAETFDALTDFNGNSMTAINVKNIVNMLNGKTQDWYKYIKSLSFVQFEKKINESDVFIATAKLYHNKNNYTIPFEDFLYKLAVRTYNAANSLELMQVARLTVNTIKDDSVKEGFVVRNTSVEILPENYYDAERNEKSSYRHKTMVTQRLPIINQILDSDLELVHLEQVQFNRFRENSEGELVNYKTDNKNIASKDFNIDDRNEFYVNMLKTQGFLFPGTWSDKKTVVAFKSKSGNKIDFSSLTEMYETKSAEIANQLFANGKITAKELKMYMSPDEDYKSNKDSYTLRMLLEDLKLGAKINKNGEFESVLFNIENANTYDALKIFKRATEVLPLQQILNDVTINNKVYNNLKDKTGIILKEDGTLAWNALILDSGSEGTFKFEYKGKKFEEILYKDILLNENKIETLDGANIEFGNWGEIIDELTGVLKEGPKKGKVLSSINKDPMYNKGAYHKTVSAKLKEWAKANNVAMIMSDTAVKINPHQTTKLFDGAYVVEIPFSEYFSDGAKDISTDDAKGLTQSLLANYTAESNSNYHPKSPEVMERVISTLSNEFIAKMYSLDASKIIEDMKRMGLEGQSKSQATINNIMVDYLYNVVGNKVTQSLQNDRIASEIGAIFKEPFFASEIKSYIKRNINKIVNFRVKSSWNTLRPDLGWLEPNIIDKVWDNVKEEIDKKENDRIEYLDKELISLQDLYDTINNPEDGKSKRLEKQIASAKKEKESIILATKEEKDAKIWSKLFTIIDEKTGRLKKGWAYVSKDINEIEGKPFNISFGDNVIMTNVPSQDATSQSAPKIAAILDDEVNKGTASLHSDYVQTVAGKDFDIDQILLTPYNSQAFTKKTYANFVESINLTIDKYQQGMLREYRNVLNEKTLDLIPSEDHRSVYDSEVAKEYMQAITGNLGQEGQKLFNPLTQSMSLLNKFYKDVGSIVNDNKMFTVQAQIGWKTTFNVGGKVYTLDPLKGIGRFSIATSRLLHDAVDSPTNTNGFFYNMTGIQKYDLIYGTTMEADMNKKGLYYNDTPENLSKEELEYYNAVQAITKTNKFLFGYATRLPADYNIDNIEEKREFEDTIKYIENQQEINKMLSEGKYQDLIDAFLNRETGFKVHITLLRNIKIDDIKKSDLLNAIESIPLNTIPELSTTYSEYLEWQMNILNGFKEDPDYKKALDKSAKVNAKFIEEFAKTTEIEYGIGDNKKKVMFSPSENMHMIEQFMVTREEGEGRSKNSFIAPLHLLKAQLITIMNPVDQITYTGTKKFADVRYDNIFDEANDKTFSKLMGLLLDKRTLKFKNNDIITLTTPKGINLNLRANSNQELEISFKLGDKAYRWTAHELLTDDTQYGIGLKKILTEDNSIFSTRAMNSKEKAYKNRYEFNRILSFTGNTDYAGRTQIAKELVNESLEDMKVDAIQKKVFWNSLLGYHVSRIPTPVNFIPSLVMPTQSNFPTQIYLLELASKVDDPSGKEFLKNYLKIASQTSPEEIGFDRAIRIKQALGNGKILTDNEVFFEETSNDRKIEVVNEDISFLNKFNTVFNIIRKFKKERNISADGILDVGIDLLTGNLIPFDRKLVTDLAKDQYASRVAAKYVSLEEIAVAKQIQMREKFNGYHVRADFLYANVQKGIQAIASDTTLSIPSIYTLTNLLSERLPYKFSVISTGLNKYTYTINGETSDDLDDLLLKTGITNATDRAIHKVALNHRIMYDYITPRIAENVASYLQYIKNNLPEGFADEAIVDAMLTKWANLAKQFDKQKGVYFPRTFEEGVGQALVLKHSAYKMLKKEHPELNREEINALIPEAMKDEEFAEQAKQNSIMVDSFNGIVYTWQMGRTLPDWIVEHEYITDNNDMHENHRSQFFSAALSDINKIEYLLYAKKAHALGKPQKLIDQMKSWYSLISKDEYLTASKININKVKVGDAIAFYKMQGDDEKYIKIVVNRISGDYLYADMDKKEYRQRAETKLKIYRKTHESISSKNYLKETPMMAFQAEALDKLDIRYPNNMSVYEASKLILTSLEDELGNEANWGRFKKSELYVKQYSGDNIIKPNGVERKWKSMEIPSFKLKNYESPKNMEEFLKGIQRLTSMLALSSPGAALRNMYESMWRTIQIVKFRRTLFHKKGDRSIQKKARDFRNKFTVSVKTGEHTEYLNTIRYLDTVESLDALKPIGNDSIAKSKHDAIEALVAVYLLQHGLGKNVQIDVADVGEKSKISSIALGLFSEAEVTNRILGAYMFAYKAVFVDNVTDIKLVKSIIAKGVARANSLYEMEYRKIFEGKAGGRFLSQFSQFNTSQLDIRRQEFEQAIRLGQWKPIWETLKDKDIIKAYENGKFNLKSMFSDELTAEDENGVIRTYKKDDSVDPLIPRMIAEQFLVDVTLGTALEFLYPGFRVGNPIHKAFYLPALMLLSMLFLRDKPSEWDISDWIFGILGFKIGLGFALPLQMIYAYAIGRPFRMPLQSKVANHAYDIGRWMISSDEYSSSKKSQKRRLSESNYYLGLLSKLGTTMDLTPYTRTYNSDAQNAITSAPLFLRPVEGIKQTYKATGKAAKRAKKLMEDIIE